MNWSGIRDMYTSIIPLGDKGYCCMFIYSIYLRFVIVFSVSITISSTLFPQASDNLVQFQLLTF